MLGPRVTTEAGGITQKRLPGGDFVPHDSMDGKGIPGREPGCMGSGQKPQLQELLNGLLVPMAISERGLETEINRHFLPTMECEPHAGAHRRHLRKISGYRDPTRKRYMPDTRINASDLHEVDCS